MIRPADILGLAALIATLVAGIYIGHGIGL